MSIPWAFNVLIRGPGQNIDKHEGEETAGQKLNNLLEYITLSENSAYIRENWYLTRVLVSDPGSPGSQIN